MNEHLALPKLFDKRGRPLTDLRVSVTDRCNFRCTYCLPRDRVSSGSFLPKSEILSFEEIESLARVARSLGVTKIRLTGGEPLLRRELPSLVERLKRFGLEIALTTNGVLLADSAAELASAGLDRVTVSLDALDAGVFAKMADAPSYGPEDVLRGIDAALSHGFSNVKVNTVVRRENLGEVRAIQRAFSRSAVVVRFIEFMDVGSRNRWEARDVVTKEEILALLEPGFVSQERRVGSPARYYENAESSQQIGIIASVSEPFCGDCSRLRVTANGTLFTCLFASEGLSIRELLRDGHDRELAETLEGVWRGRNDRYSELRGVASSSRSLPLLPRVEMSTIGG